VNCFVYRLEGPRLATASVILREWHPVAEKHWELRYGWRPIHMETMVDPTKVETGGTNPGACFRRAGWRLLGETTGLTVRRPTREERVFERGATPKLVFYRGPLERRPQEI